MCTPAPSESGAGRSEKTSVQHSVLKNQWCTSAGTFERRMCCYLVESVVGCQCHSVGVQHEPLSQKGKEAVCVHDLHLPPVDKHTQTHRRMMVKVACLELPKPLKGSVSAVSLLPSSHPRGASLWGQVSGTACCHKLGEFSL